MKHFFRVTALFFLVCGLIFSGASLAEGEVTLYCLNIGKADCMLLSYGGEHYLIDTGYAHTYAALETMLEQLQVSRLHGVILTHCHEDHEGGLSALAQSEIQVDAWYAGKIYYDVKPGKHPAVLAAAARGQSVRWLSAGDEISLGGEGRLRVLGPLSVDSENENNNSLVLHFVSPQGSLLLAGDMKEDEEGELLAAGVIPPCDGMKVGHHGDSEATSLALLRAVQPRAAIILTASQEESDTPAPGTLKRLAAVGCQVFVSQDAQDALLLTLKGGVASVQDVAWPGVPERMRGLTLRIDRAQDTLTLRNAGDAVMDLTDALAYSSKGEETLTLPAVLLAPGEEYVIGSRMTTAACDLRWDEKQVWHKKKFDQAAVYDAYGRVLARTDNGLPE